MLHRYGHFYTTCTKFMTQFSRLQYVFFSRTSVLICGSRRTSSHALGPSSQQIFNPQTGDVTMRNSGRRPARLATSSASKSSHKRPSITTSESIMLASTVSLLALAASSIASPLFAPRANKPVSTHPQVQIEGDVCTVHVSFSCLFPRRGKRCLHSGSDRAGRHGSKRCRPGAESCSGGRKICHSMLTMGLCFLSVSPSLSVVPKTTRPP
jgi:hypothetical protein